MRFRTVGGALVCLCTFAAQAQSVEQLRSAFREPPTAARPMMRWWWFGPAVQKDELNRELDAMHAAGIGGVELTSEYPLTLDDPARHLQNLRFGSPEHVAMLQSAADHARGLGMRVDLTLGSGWPFGGPQIPLNLAAGRLKVVAIPLPAAGDALPKPAEGETFVAAFVAKGTAQQVDLASAHRLPSPAWPTASAQPGNGSGSWVELIFLASHTRQQVKRAANGGEGYVLDHMARPAVDHYLETVGTTLLGGFPGTPPSAIFSDSLEVYGSDWTPSLPAEFKRRRGYDLLDHLPALVQGGTPEAEAVRHDWGETLSELVRENYLTPLAAFASAHHTRFRSQTYGEPAVTLFDEHVPQLPEGEGPQWRSFSFTRWASSANHVFGNNITSAETWTWLHSPAFRATPLDMKVEADRMFLEGVNQIIGHGFPYSPPGVAEPGWSLYAAAALNSHNPWWPVMPDVTTYLARVSSMLRQGKPANDVALLLPEADAQAEFRPGHVSVTEEMKRHISPSLMSTVLDAGYNLDYIDLPSAAAVGLHYPVVVVPPTHRITLRGVRLLAAYAKAGGKLIFLGDTPSLATGLSDARDEGTIRREMEALLRSSAHVDSDATLPAALHKTLAPDLLLDTTSAGRLGFLHRKLPNADIYFIANTSNERVDVPVTVRARRAQAEWWDPSTGNVTAAMPGTRVPFAPYESRLLVLHDGAGTPNRHPATDPTTSEEAITLTHWNLQFASSAGGPPSAQPQPVTDTLWTDEASHRFFSGEAVYRTSFTLPGGTPADAPVTLRFADPKPLPDTQPPNKPGTRAWLEPPIREAAVIFVNGKRVGSLWHPPYALDLQGSTRAGENTLEVHVYNTAINALAGQPPRDYSALKAKFGDRFQMQDMDHLEPVPSGIAGPVQIVVKRPSSAAARRGDR